MNLQVHQLLQNDTICAVSTAYGNGAIAVVRLSGKDAINICNKIFSAQHKNSKITEAASQTLHFG